MYKIQQSMYKMQQQNRLCNSHCIKIHLSIYKIQQSLHKIQQSIIKYNSDIEYVTVIVQNTFVNI